MLVSRNAAVSVLGARFDVQVGNGVKILGRPSPWSDDVWPPGVRNRRALQRSG
jgi:hypothetical protein